MIHVVMLITNIDSDFEKSISISEGREISICKIHKGHVIIFSLFQMQILKTPNYYSGYTEVLHFCRRWYRQNYVIILVQCRSMFNVFASRIHVCDYAYDPKPKPK